MSSSTLGIAMLGAGIFALEAHVPAILKAKDLVTLKAIYSRSESSATKLASADQLKGEKLDVYHGDSGLEELLKREDIGGVIVALPISKQPEVVLQCLKAGKHVLSEKPIAKDVASAKKLIETYEKEYKPKGLIWRVAENFAHEHGVLRAAELLANGKGALGPVLCYELRMSGYVKSGAKYHATAWRNVPDYQGGFLLDGGVHFAAALRVALGDLAPTQIISQTTLHRTHLSPHDTIVAIASSPELKTEPHGEEFPQPAGLPQGLGQSHPSGTVLITFAQPDLPAPFPITLRFTCLNGVLTLTAGGQWKVHINSSDPKVKQLLKSGENDEESYPSCGVPEEVAQFGRAALGRQQGQEETNKAEPRSALWDLAFIESCLTSNGKQVDVKALAGM